MLRVVYLAAFVLVHIGFLAVLDRFWGKSRLTVIAYHRVIDNTAIDFPFYSGGAVTPEMFQKHMVFVSKAFNVISIDQLIRFLKHNQPLPPRPLLITFDDGYLDNYLNAYPILRDYGFTAVIHLMTGAIDGRVMPWWDRCSYFVHHTLQDSAVLPLVGECSLATPEKRAKTLKTLVRELKNLSEQEKLAILRQIGVILGVPEPDNLSGMFMGWEHVEEISHAGIAVQPHTVTHPILTRISEQQAKDEIEASAAAVKAHSHQETVAFAYPNGSASDYDPTIVRLLTEIGCSVAFTMEPGPVSQRRMCRYPLEIPRIYAAQKDTFETFAIKLMGGDPAAIWRELKDTVRFRQ